MSRLSLRSYVFITLLLAAIDATSWFAFRQSTAQLLIIGGLSATAMMFAWKRPSWLIYLMLGEVVIGGKGYLFSLSVGGQDISIRMILFGLVVLTGSPWLIKRWRPWLAAGPRRAWSLLMIWLALAVGWGLGRHLGVGAVYRDANAFLYLLAWPWWWALLQTDTRWRERMMTIVIAGATVVGLKSWLMVLLFGQDLAGLPKLYAWIRNTGIGEVTLISRSVYRVFFQSQIYSVLVFLWLTAAWLTDRLSRWWLMPMTISGLGIYVSLSRSFWLGTGLALMVLLIMAWRRRPKLLLRGLVMVPIAVVVWGLMSWALNFPHLLPIAGQARRGEIIIARLQGKDAFSAASARQNQIQPLLIAISRHPAVGSGFGTTVAYFSTDPRIRGWRSTSAFELGYLDLWLKIGLIGVGLYAWWIMNLWQRVRQHPWGMMFVISGLGLVIIHLTTPYLNHPLGLSWLMLTALYADDHA